MAPPAAGVPAGLPPLPQPAVPQSAFAGMPAVGIPAGQPAVAPPAVWVRRAAALPGISEGVPVTLTREPPTLFDEIAAQVHRYLQGCV